MAACRRHFALACHVTAPGSNFPLSAIVQTFFSLRMVQIFGLWSLYLTLPNVAQSGRSFVGQQQSRGSFARAIIYPLSDLNNGRFHDTLRNTAALPRRILHRSGTRTN